MAFQEIEVALEELDHKVTEVLLVPLVSKETGDHKALLGALVHLDPLGLLDLKERLVSKVQLVELAYLETLAQLGQLDLQVTGVPQVQLEKQVRLDSVDQQGLRAHKATKDNLAPKAIWVRQAQAVLLDQLDQKETTDSRVIQVDKDHLGLKELQEIEVPLGNKVLKVLLEQLASVDLLVLQDFQVKEIYTLVVMIVISYCVVKL